MASMRDVITAVRARIAVLVITGILTAATAVLTTAQSASAATQCQGNVCIATVRLSPSAVTVRTYPPQYTFYGHFELETPNGGVYNSITSTWHQNGSGNYFNNINGGTGWWIARAWQPSGGGGYELLGDTRIYIIP